MASPVTGSPATEPEAPVHVPGAGASFFGVLATEASAKCRLWWSYPAITPFGWEAPVNGPPWPELLLAAKQLSCLSILVNAASMRWTVCGWRKRLRALEARKSWSDLAKTWLRFASDIEVNECLLDEWGPKGTQTGE